MSTGNQSGPVGIRREWLSYLTLAEIGYFAQAVLALIAGVLYLVSYPLISGSLVEGTSAVLIVIVSIAWFKLGTGIPVSLYTNVGILGFAFSVISLGSAFLSSYPSPIPLWEGFSLVTIVVYIAYFVYLVYAFFKAATIFQVRLFRFAGFMLIVGFIITFILSYGIEAVFAIGLTIQSLNFVLFGLSSLWSGMTNLVAGIGFRKLRSGQGMTTPTIG